MLCSFALTLRGGVPPLQRLGALRGRSPRFACPVHPLGRLSLGLVDIGVGTGFPSGLARLGLGYMRLVRGYLLGLARLGLGVLGELVGGYLLGLARLGLGYMRLVWAEFRVRLA